MTTFQDPQPQSRRAARQGERQDGAPAAVGDSDSGTPSVTPPPAREYSFDALPSDAPPSSRRAQRPDVPRSGRRAQPLDVAPGASQPAGYEPLTYMTQGRTPHDADAPGVLPSVPVAPAAEQPSFRVRDFSPEGRRAAAPREQLFSPTQPVREPSDLDYSTQGRDDLQARFDAAAAAVPAAPAAAPSAAFAPAPPAAVAPASTPAALPEPPQVASVVVPGETPEQTLSRRELRALREAEAAREAELAMPSSPVGPVAPPAAAPAPEAPLRRSRVREVANDGPVGLPGAVPSAPVAPVPSAAVPSAPLPVAPAAAASAPAPDLFSRLISDPGSLPTEAPTAFALPSVPSAAEAPAAFGAPSAPSVPSAPSIPTASVPPVAAAQPPVEPVGVAEPVFIEPATSTRPVGHWSNQLELDDEVENTITRTVGGNGGGLATSALVLPSVPTVNDITSPYTATGEILVTGSIHLPRSLGATGALPHRIDNSDFDDDPLDREVPSTDSAPVRAIRAVSTHTGTNGVIAARTVRTGNRMITVTIVTAVTLAAGLVTVLGVAVANGVF